jgi:hypothetical protein
MGARGRESNGGTGAWLVSGFTQHTVAGSGRPAGGLRPNWPASSRALIHEVDSTKDEDGHGPLW